MAIHQMFLGLGAVVEKTYVDDIFSTFLYAGNDSVIPINNTLKLGTAGVGSVIQSANSGSNALVVSDSNDFQFYNGDFTFECFAKINNQGDDPDYIYIQRQNGPDPYVELRLGSSSGDDANIIFIVGGISGDSNKELEGVATNVVNGNWHHIAATRSGSTWKLFYDGTQIDTLTSSSTSIGNSPADPKIFGGGGSSETFRGALSNFRIVKGTAVYTSNFTPPTAELTAITNTVLLLGVGSTPAVDASGQNHSISTTGTVDSFTSGGPFTSSDAGLGGLVWIKSRTSGYGNFLFDTARGTATALATNLTNANFAEVKGVTHFNANGFTLGGSSGDGAFNASGTDYASFTFRKAEGFFDIVTWTGNASGPRSISHNLGSVPGLIMVKCKSAGSTDWMVWHRDFGATDYLTLNSTATKGTNESKFGGQVSGAAKPTSTTFALGTSNDVNGSGNTYIAYLFAGGESTAATARSVEFDGNSDYLSLESNSDLAFGTGDFTFEFWVKMTTVQYTIFFDMRPNPAASQGVYPTLYLNNGVSLTYYANSANRITGPGLEAGQWYHIAVSRSGTSTKMFLNGTQVGLTYSDSNDYVNGDTTIGCRADGSTGDLDGYMSNVRVVKGTALYTSSFRPPTEPLTNITNTKLLCCNNSSTTGSTVTPGTITANGTTASTDSPFDDPAGFVFGDSEEGTIKHGSYPGDGSKDHHIHLGWEPSWVMIKCTTASENWILFDVMRGIVTGGNDGKDAQLSPNTSGSEVTNNYALEVTPTGFKLSQDQAHINSSGNSYIFTAIRRPDGYVGKPLELGTSAFAMSYGNGSSAGPCFDSDFAVDFALRKIYGSIDDWWNVNRLTGKKYLKTNGDDSESNHNDNLMDYNDGWGAGSIGSGMQSWMWKRHAGLDVVAYEGDGVNGRSIAHSMNDVPEMMIVKRRSSSEDWTVYHTGLNGGTNPYTRLMTLNSTASEVDMTSTPEKVWKSTPTSTHFEIGSHDRVNTDGEDYLALLFSSIDGVSKIGSYTGSTSNLTITTGFQPRFILIKGYDSNSNGRYWIVMDSLRGINPSGNTDYLFLNQSSAQNSNGPEPFISGISSTGFTLLAGKGDTNASFPGNFTRSYIYYAHA